MKKKYLSKKLLSLIIIVSLSVSMTAQIKIASENSQLFIDWDVCTYYPAKESAKISKARSEFVKKQMKNKLEPCSTFIVSYNGFTPQARASFQFAVDIWSNLLESSVPIRVNANFEELPENVLGSAGPNGYIGLTSDDGSPTSFYSRPLAEALLGVETEGFDNETPSIDITATFSSEPGLFYFPTDLNTPSDRIDFVTVVLHELGHGLGILGFGSVNDRDFAGFPQIPTEGEINPGGFPSIWDRFIENGPGTSVLAFDDPSEELLTQFTSNNLFSNGAITTSQNQGVKPKIFAPNPFKTGSSYSHWDEVTYPAGNSNALMTPSLARGEANHDPGVVTLGFMEDMGWSICGGTLTIEEFETSSIEISPNPFVSSISVRLANNQNDNYSINLIDINGRIILTKNKTSNDNVITLSNLSNLDDALYFIKITNTTNGTSITKKVIKN